VAGLLVLSLTLVAIFISCSCKEAYVTNYRFCSCCYNSVQFLIYLRAELKRHWPVRVSTNTNNSNMTAQDKTNKEQQRKQQKKKKNELF
jgi:hypothetical protein